MNQVDAIPVSQAMLFQRLRWRLLRNGTQLLLRQGQTRVLTIFVCSLLIWITLFAVSYYGFREIQQKYDFPLDGGLIALTFALGFTALTIFLIFSTCIILYSSLFASAETSFLLSSPVRDDQIFAYKFQGAVAFSSYAFILLGSPVLLSYGLIVAGGAPWYFYVMLPFFFLGYVLVPGCLGALICLLLVNYLPRHRKQALTLALVLVAGGATWWVYHLLAGGNQGLFTRDWVSQVVGGFLVFRKPWMPAHWIAQGLQSAALGDVGAMFYYLVLVWANGLFLYLVTSWFAWLLYRRGFNRVVTGGNLRRRYGGGTLDNFLDRLLPFLDPQTRLLIVKDFRTFRRDPAQWLQILIFVGLIALYFVFIRFLYEEEIGRAFRNSISLLNLAATGFLVCAYTGRFIFPMLSLEGRKFWILGLLPMERDRLLHGKFMFSASGALLVAEFLVVFSDVMLDIPWLIVELHALTVAVLTVSMSGLSVGLGACLPNFRETDPSKIAVGFGGTLNLVASLLLLVAVIGLMAAPLHLFVGIHRETPLTLHTMPWFVWLGVCAGLGVGLAATFFPLRAGARALRRMEF
jgi:ABC-2 type transport system permease protein